MYSLLWALDITFSLILSVHCTSLKLHTLAWKGNLLSRKKEKEFLIQSIHLFIPHYFASGHTEFRGFYNVSHVPTQTFRLRTDLCACIHTQITGSHLHCSSSCLLVSHMSLQGYTNTTGEIHAPSEPPLYLALTICTKSSYTEIMLHVCLTLQMSFH